MFTYSHANTPLSQSECAYYLNYFIDDDVRYLYIILYPTKTQSALQGLMADFFMVQVAAVTILN